MPPTTLPDDLLTLRDAARVTGLALATIRRWVWSRRIASIRIGRAVRVRRAELARILLETPARR